MKKTPEKLTFEQSLERLNEIVQALETGDLPLNESLKLFEEGVKLSRECSKELNDAKGKLEMLVKSSDGILGTEPFEV